MRSTLEFLGNAMAYVNGAVTGQLTSHLPESKILRDIQMETFLTVYRTRCWPSAVPRRRSANARHCNATASVMRRFVT